MDSRDSEITSLDKIKSVRVHWSESRLINDVMGANDDDDIEKDILPLLLDKLIRDATGNVQGSTSDKTVLTIELQSGETWCTQCKFYIRAGTDGLLDLIKM